MDWSRFCNTPEKTDKSVKICIFSCIISLIGSILTIAFCFKQIYDDKKLIEENNKQEE